MECASDIESEVKSWLQIIFKKENLKNLFVNILRNSEKGDSHVGDVVFVDVTGTTESGSTRKYNLVLKCSKRSQVLRDQSITKEAFSNETYIYETLMPLFTQFQQDKKVTDYFDSVPKCYGTYTGENIEVIALDNLKELGYQLWEKKEPLPRSHIDKVVEEYGKFHAVSIAIQYQQPQTCEGFKTHFENIFEQIRNKGDSRALFCTCIEEVYELLKGDLEDIIMEKWKNLKEQVYLNFEEIENTDVKVIVHGDCWNNNFMYYYDNIEKKVPTKVVILDWQMSRLASPVVDLSYFIFTCISEDDLEDIGSILEKYYKFFSQHLTKLGTDPDSVYSFNQLLEDWRKYCKYGIILTSLVFKICSTEKDEVIDTGEAAEEGVEFYDSFLYKIRDTNNFKSRMKPIIQYGVKHGLF